MYNTLVGTINNLTLDQNHKKTIKNTFAIIGLISAQNGNGLYGDYLFWYISFFASNKKNIPYYPVGVIAAREVWLCAIFKSF